MGLASTLGRRGRAATLLAAWRPGRVVPVRLWSALVAGLLLAAGMALGLAYVRSLEQRALRGLAPLAFQQKGQGIALQRLAFEQPDLLPLYGSSELAYGGPFQPARFFRNAPTGFAVFSVAQNGAGSLIYLQALAALGTELRDKRVVISLTPGDFFDPMLSQEAYAGNFSRLHALRLAFGAELSAPLRQEVARRMLDYPRTLDGDPALAVAVHCMANPSRRSRALYDLVYPLGRLELLVLELQDHWASLSAIEGLELPAHAAPSRHPATIDWAALLAKAERTQRQKAGRAPFGFDAWYWHTHAGELRREQGSETDAEFLAALRGAREWTDLRLLLRTLKELHARPLLLGLPISGPFYDFMGVSADARAAYYARLRTTAASRGVPLVDLAAHDGDLGFVVDRWSHPGRQASLAFDRALDAFYHGALPVEVAANGLLYPAVRLVTVG